MAKHPFRVVVCGTVFGQIYLNALARAAPDILLCGLLARGSARSAACARVLNVPLFTALDEVPSDTDAACVVVRGDLLGGAGTRLARACLDRGLHVLQEHPVHRDELAGTLRVAHGADRAFMLNSFYPHLPETRRTIAVLHALQAERRLRWIDAMTSYQVAFALLDVLAEALGGLDGWSLGRLAGAETAGWPWQGVVGTLNGVPVTIRVQMEMDPAEPDGGNALLHRLTFGMDGGTLTQTDVHGPLVWTAEPAFPAATRHADSAPYFEGLKDDPFPAGAVLAEGSAAGYADLFGTSWASGVRQAVSGLQRMASDPEARRQHARRMLLVCRLWAELSDLVGLPSTPARGPGTPLTEPEIAALRRVAAGASADGRRPVGRGGQ